MADAPDQKAIEAAQGMAKTLMEKRQSEKTRLEKLIHYREHGVEEFGVMSDARIMGMPPGVPMEVRQLAKKSRVNLMRFVVATRVQDMYVDGFQTDTAPDNVPAWDIWQANGMDARQIGVHRAALTYGASYVVVLPGKPEPVIRGLSPRHLTAVYGDDDTWPVAALWKMRGRNRWRLLDETYVWEMQGPDDGQLTVLGAYPHKANVGGAPIVRFRDTIDLDHDKCEVIGVVEPLIELQDQINITSFGLQVAQHYGAFRQRYILGWLADSETEALKTGASRLMMFEDGPGDIQVGEFGQTALDGYISSREASIRHLATVSQTPVHELMGQFVNLSAEALQAARASHQAAVEENRISAGESWEQVLRLSASLSGGDDIEPSASVVWRDTTMRTLNEVAAALGLLVTQLGVPPKALWSRIPGATQQEIDQWKALADEPGAFDDLMALLNKTAAPADGQNA